MKYMNIAYPLSSYPSEGKCESLPEFYTEYQQNLDDRIKKEKAEQEEKQRKDYYKFFKHFFETFEEDEGEIDLEEI